MSSRCPIVKDLIPLYIDGVVSEESKNYIEEHVSECDECRGYLDSMRQLLSDKGGQMAEEEEKLFSTVAASMRRKRHIRVLRIVLLGIVLGILLLFAVYGAWNELYVNNAAIEMSTEDYEVVLSRLENGKVIANIKMKNDRLSGGWNIRTEEMADGTIAMVVSLKTSVFPRKANGSSKHMAFLTTLDLDKYSSVYVGKNLDKLVWQQGDLVPSASRELEEYYAARRELSLLYAQMDYEEQIAYITGEDYLSIGAREEHVEETERKEKQRELEKRIEDLVRLVPEWK